MTDWENIKREDEHNHGKMALLIGWTFMGLAVIGTILGLGDRAVVPAVVNLLIEVPMLIIGLRLRRRNTQASGQ